MSKRDRQGVRTPANLEQKYAFGKTMSDFESALKRQSDQISRQSQSMNEYMSTSTEKFLSVEKGIASVEKDVTKVEKDIVKLDARITQNYNSLKKTLDNLPGGGGGEDGATFTPSVDEDGNLSWTNDKGLPNPSPVNMVEAVISALPVYNGEVIEL